MLSRVIRNIGKNIHHGLKLDKRIRTIHISSFNNQPPKNEFDQWNEYKKMKKNAENNKSDGNENKLDEFLTPVFGVGTNILVGSYMYDLAPDFIALPIIGALLSIVPNKSVSSFGLLVSPGIPMCFGAFWIIVILISGGI